MSSNLRECRSIVTFDPQSNLPAIQYHLKLRCRICSCDTAVVSKLYSLLERLGSLGTQRVDRQKIRLLYIVKRGMGGESAKQALVVRTTIGPEALHLATGMWRCPCGMYIGFSEDAETQFRGELDKLTPEKIEVLIRSKDEQFAAQGFRLYH